MNMKEELLGNWVEVELVNAKKWIGILQEWDEEAVFISNGYPFGHTDHKGAECTNEEVKAIVATSKNEFSVA